MENDIITKTAKTWSTWCVILVIVENIKTADTRAKRLRMRKVSIFNN